MTNLSTSAPINQFMDILYLGSFFPEKQRKEIFLNSKGVVQNGGNTYQTALLNGLTEYKIYYNFKIITSPMLGSFPFRYKKLFYRGCKFAFKSTIECQSNDFMNLSLCKNISRYNSIIRDIKEWSASNNSTEKYIIVFSLDLPLIKAACEMKQVNRNIHICLIITDLFEFMVAPTNLFYKKYSSYQNRVLSYYLKFIDSFVLLTEDMKNKIDIGKRPYIVIEGIFDERLDNKHYNYEKEQFKTILYTGTLAKSYGIMHLINAFSLINDDNYRLWICGEGDSRNELIEKCKKDKRINYFGQLPREEVLILQKRATVLVNPRLSKEEFTKYSFPSKTMEYLASGTPLIMHPLKCLTYEYLSKIFIAYDESDEGLKNKIIEVCEKPQEELRSFGNEASKFIFNRKNSFVQAGKLIDLLKK